MKKKLFALFLSAAALTLFACFNSDSSNTDNPAGTAGTELEGTWKTACYNKNGDPYDRIDTFVISGNNFTWTEVHYNQSTSCGTVHVSSPTEPVTGTFTIGSTFTAATGETGAKEFDMDVVGMGMYYTCYYLSGTTLRFGDDTQGNDGSSVAARIIHIEPDGPFTKQ